MQQTAVLMPRVGTRITGHGEVIMRDVTFYGLHRMCVQSVGRYPDLEMWVAMVSGPVWLYHYGERSGAGQMVGLLWLYWK
jgi:hypothetical protein